MHTCSHADGQRNTNTYVLVDSGFQPPMFAPEVDRRKQNQKRVVFFAIFCATILAGGGHREQTGRNDLGASETRWPVKEKMKRYSKIFRSRSLAIEAHMCDWRAKHKLLHDMLSRNTLIESDQNAFDLLSSMRLHHRKAWAVYKRWVKSEKALADWIRHRLEQVGFEFGSAADSDDEKRLLKKIRRREPTREEKHLRRQKRKRYFVVRGGSGIFDQLNGIYYRTKGIFSNNYPVYSKSEDPSLLIWCTKAPNQNDPQDDALDTWIIGRNTSFPSSDGMAFTQGLLGQDPDWYLVTPNGYFRSQNLFVEEVIPGIDVSSEAPAKYQIAELSRSGARTGRWLDLSFCRKIPETSPSAYNVTVADTTQARVIGWANQKFTNVYSSMLRRKSRLRNGTWERGSLSSESSCEENETPGFMELLKQNKDPRSQKAYRTLRAWKESCENEKLGMSIEEARNLTLSLMTPEEKQNYLNFTLKAALEAEYFRRNETFEEDQQLQDISSPDTAEIHVDALRHSISAWNPQNQIWDSTYAIARRWIDRLSFRAWKRRSNGTRLKTPEFEDCSHTPELSWKDFSTKVFTDSTGEQEFEEEFPDWKNTLEKMRERGSASEPDTPVDMDPEEDFQREQDDSNLRADLNNTVRYKKEDLKYVDSRGFIKYMKTPKPFVPPRNLTYNGWKLNYVWYEEMPQRGDTTHLGIRNENDLQKVKAFGNEVSDPSLDRSAKDNRTERNPDLCLDDVKKAFRTTNLGELKSGVGMLVNDILLPKTMQSTDKKEKFLLSSHANEDLKLMEDYVTLANKEDESSELNEGKRNSVSEDDMVTAGSGEIRDSDSDLPDPEIEKKMEEVRDEISGRREAREKEALAAKQELFRGAKRINSYTYEIAENIGERSKRTFPLETEEQNKYTSHNDGAHAPRTEQYGDGNELLDEQGSKFFEGSGLAQDDPMSFFERAVAEKQLIPSREAEMMRDKKSRASPLVKPSRRLSVRQKIAIARGVSKRCLKNYNDYFAKYPGIQGLTSLEISTRLFEANFMPNNTIGQLKPKEFLALAQNVTLGILNTKPRSNSNPISDT